MTETARLDIGRPAPDFTLPDQDGSPVSLSHLRGRKVVLYVYPQAATPGCTTQACDFRDRLRRFTDHGYAVLGLSPDAPAALARFHAQERLTFPLLSDPDKKVMTAYGAYGEKKLYGKTVTGVRRSTFVLDEQGVVTQASYSVKATGHVAKLLRDLGLDDA